MLQTGVRIASKFGRKGLRATTAAFKGDQFDSRTSAVVAAAVGGLLFSSLAAEDNSICQNLPTRVVTDFATEQKYQQQTEEKLNAVLYPEIQPYRTAKLKVSDVHELYYEECGNPNGKPVIMIHGGPGAGCGPVMRRYHDPKKYRIILLDQRGAGKSTPHACLENNTTWDLVEDIEKLRNHLKIEKWQVFGGSWGSTLSIAYAETHPSRVCELVLRGIFQLRKKELDFYYQSGSSFLFPDRWEPYRDHIPENERDDYIKAYHKRLTSDDPSVRIPAAIAWTTWEKTTSNLIPPVDAAQNSEKDVHFAEAFARIENHYFYHKGFFPTDNYLNENIEKIRHIPTVIIQGRYDVVCPMVTAWEFAQVFPEAHFRVVADAGHSAKEVGIASELIHATDKFCQS